MFHTLLKILTLASITLSCGDLPQKDETAHDVIITTDTMTYATVSKELSMFNSFQANLIIGEDTITSQARKDFVIPPLEKLLENQRFTSGRCNSLRQASFEQDDDFNYGCYYIASPHIKNRNPIVAKIFVRFKSLPWRENDPEQEVMAIIINNKCYNLTELEIQVGQDGYLTRSIYSNAESSEYGYKFNLKSSIINTFAPLNSISSIAIIKKEGLKNIDSFEYDFFGNTN
ncbi:MAG: hypothetical protein AB8B53_12845 [Flavobacteriales bacterium]